MADKPTLPRTRQRFDDLSELIDHSIAQQDKFGAPHGKPAQTSDAKVVAASQNPPPIVNQTMHEISKVSEAKQKDPVERFQITAPASVIVATKIEAVKRSTTAAAIVELALRQYLNLPPAD